MVNTTFPNDVNLDDQGEREPREECGVFGVWAPGEDVATLTYFGLFALQHRGQEAAGIGVGDGDRLVVFKDMGLVSNIFDESILNSLHGSVGVGHTRYSTAGGKEWSNVQPMFNTTANGVDIALCHNGNLVNYQELREEAVAQGLYRENEKSLSDSMVMTALLAHGVGEGKSVFDAAKELLPDIKGAFCLTFTDGKTLYAARDPHGVRPLVLGRLAQGWVVASETCALDIVGAQFIREVEPGELISINEAGVRSETFAETKRQGCVFEYVYLARPDTVIKGRNVHATRVDIGRALAKSHPAHDADMVIPVPESGKDRKSVV